MGSPRTAMKCGPRSAQLEEAWMQEQRQSTATKQPNNIFEKQNLKILGSMRFQVERIENNSEIRKNKKK